MSVENTEQDYVEASVVDGSVSSVVSIDTVATFELEHDLFETTRENITARLTGLPLLVYLCNIICYNILLLQS